MGALPETLTFLENNKDYILKLKINKCGLVEYARSLIIWKLKEDHQELKAREIL